jgi:hypothetical protein
VARAIVERDQQVIVAETSASRSVSCQRSGAAIRRS